MRMHGFGSRGLLLVAFAVALRAQQPESAGLAAEQEGRLGEALDLYLAALRSLPDPPPAGADVRLRERAVKLASRMMPPPAIPEDTLRFTTRAMVLFKEARGKEDFAGAAAELEKALRAAPWYGPALFNLAIVQERLEQYEAALGNLRLYLLAAPGAPNAAQVQAKVYQLEMRTERQSEALAKYAAGEWEPQDAAEAQDLYCRACDGGIGRGCSDLGLVQLGSDAGPQEGERAVALFQQGCEKGDGRGCGRLGMLHLFGVGMAKDDGRAVSQLKRGCDQGDGWSCGVLAFLYAEGMGVAKDKKRAAQLAGSGCEAAYAPACRLWAAALEKGEGVPEDRAHAAATYQKAFQLSQRTCAAGNWAACFRVAAFYSEGRVVAKDKARVRAFDDQGHQRLQKELCDEGSCAGVAQAYARWMDPLMKAWVDYIYPKGCVWGDKKACRISIR